MPYDIKIYFYKEDYHNINKSVFIHEINYLLVQVFYFSIENYKIDSYIANRIYSRPFELNTTELGFDMHVTFSHNLYLFFIQQ